MTHNSSATGTHQQVRSKANNSSSIRNSTDNRQDRLAAALRENLRKRRAQLRARGIEADVMTPVAGQ